MTVSINRQNAYWDGISNDKHDFFVGSETVFTPRSLVENMIEITLKIPDLDIHNSTILVIQNVEFVLSLVMEYKINPDNITFVSDHDNKTKMINTIGVYDITTLEKIKESDMKHDIVFTNPPFNHIPEFEKIANDHSNQYVWVVAKSSHMQCPKKFKEKNVVYFKNLGVDTFKEQIQICSYLINKEKNENDPIYVEGIEGKIHQTNQITIMPGPDTDAWKFAQDVVNSGLPSYDSYNGSRIRRTAKIVEEGGVKCIWSSGGKNDILWGMIDKSQKDDLFGIGQHKVFVTETYAPGRMGWIKYADPSFGLSRASRGFIVKSKQDAIDAIEYLNTPQVKKLIKGIKIGTDNSKAIFAMIPHHSQKDKWFHLYND